MHGRCAAADGNKPSAGNAEPCSSDHWNCLWIAILLSFSKSFASARTDHSLLLPSAADPASAATCPIPDQSLYYRPVIGILSHPGDGASGRLNNATDASYIAASYVKFVESAGARVIPLVYNEPMETLAEVGEL